jgi:hexosaminidase
MPGHTNAALASYAELNCNGVAPALYTGTNVGFSSLCVSKAITYTFVDNVVSEISALTPGAYFHMGGDESSATTPADYVTFVNQAMGIITSHSKQVLGWEDISAGTLPANTVIQHWNNATTTLNGVNQGAKVLMSPASKAYLDMKYSHQTKLGQTWAGIINVQTGYSWDPATQISGLAESSIVGVEAPLWTETIVTSADIDYMTYPRLPGYAEIGWSPATGRNWTEYKVRLGAHGPRLTALGVNFFASSEVPWQ